MADSMGRVDRHEINLERLMPGSTQKNTLRVMTQRHKNHPKVPTFQIWII
jgi:hypothetical protein